MAAARLTPDLAPRKSTSLHATAVVIHEAGVLIRGASGAGKSSLALALIEAAADAGAFARLVGDDRILVAACNGRLIARGHQAILGRIEQRGVGILEKPYLSAAVIRLIVDLAPDAQAPRLPDPPPPDAREDPREFVACDDWDFRALERTSLSSVRLPRLRLPDRAASTDLARAVLHCFRRLRSGD